MRVLNRQRGPFIGKHCNISRPSFGFSIDSELFKATHETLSYFKMCFKSSLIRSSIEAVFLARLKPVLATVLSRVDINNNTNLVNDPDVKKLFLDILEICEHHSLSFEDIQLTQKSSGDIQVHPMCFNLAILF